MTPTPEDFAAIADDVALRREAWLERFEREWRHGSSPSLEHFLLAAPPADREALLRDLAPIDLERRLARGDDVRVEDYCRRFPGLALDRAALLELIESELRFDAAVRPAGGLAALRARFPDLAEEMLHRFSGFCGAAGADASSRLAGRDETPTTPNDRRFPNPAPLGNWADYELLEEIGRGGMGVVYRARQIGLDRIVALKMTLAGRLAASEERRRFFAEAKAAARLRHPGIVTVYEVGEWDGQPYFSMEYVQGISLATLARRGVMPCRQAAAFVRKISQAMQHAHDHGIVHRDLKPSNVMLAERRGILSPDSAAMDERQYEPLVTDFGLAHRVEANGEGTVTGQVLGTPGYMPPEQATGQAHDLGPPVDVYSLGAVLYELLAGRPPFHNFTVYATLRDVIELDPVPPRSARPAIPRDLETICLKCLEKIPARRYASAQALAEDLGRFLRDEPIRARPLGVANHAWRWIRRRPAIAGLGLALAVAGVLAISVTLLARRDQRRSTTAELAQSVRDLLDRPSLDKEFDRTLDVALERLREIDAVEAHALSRTAFSDSSPGGKPGSYVAYIEERLDQSRLTEAEASDLQAVVERLRMRDAAAAARLEIALRDRLVRWQDEMRLSTPGEAWRELFAAEETGVSIEAPGARRSGGDGRRPMLLELGSHADQELEVSFSNWEVSTLLGVGFGFSENAEAATPSHALLIFADGEADPFQAQTTLGAAQAAGAGLCVQIRRAGMVALESTVAAGNLSGLLRVRLRREGTRLAWSVQGGTGNSFDEIFSLPEANRGRLGLYWQAGTGLAALRFSRPVVPQEASLLEKGDHFLARGEHVEALTFFERELARTSSEDMRREARYKRAVCLTFVQRNDEATVEFEALAAQENGLAPSERRWSGPAMCQLWSLLVRSGRMPEADALITNLESQYPLEDLALLAPAEVRTAIIKAYTVPRAQGGYYGIIDLSAHISRLRRAIRILTAMQAPVRQLDRARSVLVEALVAADRFEEATGILSEVYARTDVSPADLDAFDSMQIWIYVQAGRPQLAIDLLDLRMHAAEGAIRTGYESYLVIRARLHGRMGNWGEALADLDRYAVATRHESPGEQDVGVFLVRGFVLKKLGDPGQGLPEWEQGFDLASQLGAFQLLDTTILGSLTGRFRLEDASKIIDDIPQVEGSIINERVRKQFVSDEFLIALLRNMWRTPRGAEVAERIEFFGVSYAEALFLQGVIGAQEVFRQAIVGESTPDEPFAPQLTRQMPDDVEAMMWDAANAFSHEFFVKRLTELDLMRIFQTYYNGVTNVFLGWDGVRDRLRPEVRGPIAYAFARRLAQRGDLQGARDLIATAISDALTLQTQEKAHAATLKRAAESFLAELPDAGGH